jgi:hypothetical protein
MGKLNLILGALSALFILYLAYLDNRSEELDRRLVANRLECQQQINRLQSGYQAEIDDLQQYLRQQYNYTPPAAAARQTKNTTGESRSADREQKDVQAIDHKYRYLYSELPDLRDAAKEMLQQLLLERDQLRESDAPDPQELGAIEAQIGELLGAGGYQQYQILKDSDIEQHHLEEFANGIRDYAPITPEQDKALLFAKLRHKQIYEMALRDSSFYQERLTPEEREYAQSVINRALETYKNNYLMEATQFLSESQLSLLKKYEATEFNWELERLTKQMDAKQ